MSALIAKSLIITQVCKIQRFYAGDYRLCHAAPLGTGLDRLLEQNADIKSPVKKGDTSLPYFM